MFESVRDFIEEFRPEDIERDEASYMEAYCLLIAGLADRGEDFRDCEKGQPYDDSLTEKAVTGLTNLVVPFVRGWRGLLCVQQANSVGVLLNEVVLPHFGSYEAIPEQYRRRIEQSMAAIERSFPA